MSDSLRGTGSRFSPQLLIGGQWRDATSGKTFAVLDPADGGELTRVADGGVDDARAALDAAVAAQRDWAATPPRERAEVLRRAFDGVQDAAEDLAMLMSLEMGKSLAESRGEVGYGGEFLRWYAEEAVRIAGQWLPSPAGGSRVLTMRKPVGPCLLVTPWNFPLAMGTRKIGPAVAAGCTMVVKPAEETPLTTLALARILQEAGLPDGVLNVVTGTDAAGISKELQSDARLRKVSFTGSTKVGSILVEQSAQHLQRSSMELGGNAPFLVFDDADLDAAVDGAMQAKMRNMGEACTSANRFLVHADVAAAFADRLTERMSALRVGRGQDDGVDVGPMIGPDAVASMADLVDDAVRGGATLRCGGERIDGPGYFYPPTVLTDVPRDARINREEIFGPVAPVSTFTDEDDAVARANDTVYGLSSYLYTRDLERSFRVAERLEYGMVGLNAGVVSNPAAPFGGVKASGFGREGGFEGIDEYLETMYVQVPGT